MSRNSYRGLTFALVLVVSFGIALPAFASPVDRILSNQEGLLVRIWDWIGHLWRGAAPPREQPKPVAAKAGVCDPDRGVLIDPNGNPCNH
ncbi:MAG TPA: hypothetical protein VFR31_21630 [Thermoanaerobaculia bacterium]|nr:hypothetical protein [Thermoanaerobaculia bacterium]